MGKAALEDVGIGYSQEEQEDFLSNPAKQEKAFEEFTKQNHEYLLHNLRCIAICHRQKNLLF